MTRENYPIIETRGLQKIYKDGDVETLALENVDLKINKGEFLAIMGPSGSGKSTLLHILGMLDRPSGGAYLLDGKNMEKYGDDELAKLRNRKFGFIFQAFNLLPRTTVLDNVRLPLAYANVPDQKQEALALKAIKAVGLEHRVNHESSQLSGGEKQRVAIARALVNNPEVIFADEPTGNLDSKSGGQVMEFLEDLNEQGQTIILITHETYTSQFAERIIRLKDGKIESDEKIEHRRKRQDGFIK